MAKKAFIIGANTLGLLYAEQDARLMAECLQHHEYTIITPLISKTDIIEQFDTFIDEAAKTDTLIFYFSGHGYPAKGKLQIVLEDDLSKSKSLFSINHITEAFEHCRAQNKLIILDCCKAGIATDDWNPEQSERYRMLTASERLQKTKELDELEASFLTFHLYQALQKPPNAIVDTEGKIRVNALGDWSEKQAKQHNAMPDAIQVPIPNLLGNHRANLEIATIARPSKESPQTTYEKIAAILITVLKTRSPAVQIAGVLLSLILLLYRGLVREAVQTKIPEVTQNQAAILISLIIILLFSIAVIAIYAQFIKGGESGTKKSLLFLAVVAVICSYTLAVLHLTFAQIRTPGTSSKIYEDHPLFEGYQFLKEGDLDKAEMRFRDAMRLTPQSPEPGIGKRRSRWREIINRLPSIFWRKPSNTRRIIHMFPVLC